MSANDKQVDGNHYKDLQASCPECGAKIDHWDWAADMPYLEGRCTAYIARHQHKKGLVDIEKGLHFIQKILEKRYGMQLKWQIFGEGEPRGPEEKAFDEVCFTSHGRIHDPMSLKDLSGAADMQNPYAKIVPE